MYIYKWHPTFYKKRATQNYPKNYGHEFSSIFFIMNIAVACTFDIPRYVLHTYLKALMTIFAIELRFVAERIKKKIAPPNSCPYF